jgi:hypothetical protein
VPAPTMVTLRISFIANFPSYEDADFRQKQI